MKKENIEKVIAGIDDSYLVEAEGYKKSSHQNVIIKYAIGAAAAFAIVCFLSFGTMTIAVASGSKPAYDLLYALFPEIAENLVPVNKSCQDNGIEVRVQSIYVHNNEADVNISITDLEDDRLDETIDLFDSYSIEAVGDQIGCCDFVSYDSESKTATFLVQIEGMSKKPITELQISFSMNKILTGKNNIKVNLDNINLNEIVDCGNYESVNEFKISSERYFLRGEAGDAPEISNLLLPDSNKTFYVTDGISVTSYGIVDDRLHVQVYYEDILKYDNHGCIWLKDKTGAVTDCMMNIAFWDEQHCGSYEEYIFDIPLEQLSNYTVVGDFTSCDTLIEGDWEITFPLRDTQEVVE